MIVWGKDLIVKKDKSKRLKKLKKLKKVKKVKKHGKTKSFSKRRSSEYLEKTINQFDISLPNDPEIKIKRPDIYNICNSHYINDFEKIAAFLILHQNNKKIRDFIQSKNELMDHLKPYDCETEYEDSDDEYSDWGNGIGWEGAMSVPCNHIGIRIKEEKISYLYKLLNSSYLKLPCNIKQSYKSLKEDIDTKKIHIGTDGLYRLGYTNYCGTCNAFKRDLLLYSLERENRVDISNILLDDMKPCEINKTVKESIERPWCFFRKGSVRNLMDVLDKRGVDIKLPGIYVTPDNRDVVMYLMKLGKVDIDDTLHKNVNILLGITRHTRIYSGWGIDDNKDASSMLAILKAIDLGADVERPFINLIEYGTYISLRGSIDVSLERMIRMILSTKTKDMGKMRVYFSIIYKMIRYKTYDRFSRKRLRGFQPDESPDLLSSTIVDMQSHLFAKVMGYLI